MGDVYEELLASLDRRALRVPCDQLLRKSLAQTQQSAEDAAVALRRLQDVTLAARKLRVPLEGKQLKDVSTLRRRVSRAFKRARIMERAVAVNRVSVGDEGDDARLSGKHATPCLGDGVGPVPPDRGFEEHPGAEVPELSVSEATVLEHDFDSPQKHSDIQEPQKVVPIVPLLAEQCEDVDERNGDSEEPFSKSGEAPDHVPAPRLRQALKRVVDDPSASDLVKLGWGNVQIPKDFDTKSLNTQIETIRTLAASINALVCTLASSESSPGAAEDRRSMLVLRFAEAVHFVVHFVTETNARRFDSNELLGVLDCIGSVRTSCNDPNASLERLKVSENDLVGFLQEQDAPALHEWDLKKRQTANKRREFRNVRATLESWLHNKKCRGSALDRMMDQFERLLTTSLSLWDVAKDGVVRACVQDMMTIASKVGGSTEKGAARARKLDAFRNILTDEAP